MCVDGVSGARHPVFQDMCPEFRAMEFSEEISHCQRDILTAYACSRAALSPGVTDLRKKRVCCDEWTRMSDSWIIQTRNCQSYRATILQLELIEAPKPRVGAHHLEVGV